ncbi:MAG: hypothetical protein R2844_09175 [Caldilineales bacterium]
MNSAFAHFATLRQAQSNARPALRRALLLLVVLAAMTVAGCTSQPITGPAVATSETQRAFALFATDTPTPAPSATSTATPTATPSATPTPTPTATPLAASAAGRAPVGRVVFGVTRAGEATEHLWLLDGAGDLAELADAVAPGAWTCSPAQPASCAILDADGYLLATWPVSGTAALLDQLTATDVTSPTVAGGPLALSPDGGSLAVALPGRVDLYGLEAPALDASIAVTHVTELAWSPDGEMLALVYPVADATALALWNRSDGRLRVVAQMDSVRHAVWSPDSDKIAFDAFQQPPTPPSQADRTDVFVLFLRSGEIANFSEVALRNNGVAAADRVAAWSPAWESADVLRYVRGVPDAPATHQLLRHPVSSRRPTQAGLLDDNGTLGVIRSPDGTMDARAVAADGRVVVQVSPVENGEWADLPGAFDHLDALAWSPAAGEVAGERYLLLEQDQNLLAVEISSGAIQGLALACPDCVITRSFWLP